MRLEYEKDQIAQDLIAQLREWIALVRALTPTELEELREIWPRVLRKQLTAKCPWRTATVALRERLLQPLGKVYSGSSGSAILCHRDGLL